MQFSIWQQGFPHLPSDDIDLINNELCTHDIKVMKEVCKSWNLYCQHFFVGKKECDYKFIANCCSRYGYLPRLKWAKDNCFWYHWVCTLAAEYGHLDCLQYAHENGCSLNWASRRAIENGHLDCLKYICKNCSFVKIMGEEYTRKAAEFGRLDCLKYLHENNFPWNEDTCVCAVLNGHFDCLKYACENGCKWGFRTYNVAENLPEYMEYLNSIRENAKI
jgi:hypothetical protein